MTATTSPRPLPREVQDTLLALLHSPPDPITAATLPDEIRERCRPLLLPVAEALEDGPGFVILQPPEHPLDDRQRTLLYWLVGQVLGQPVEQNIQGTLLYDVRDTGQDVSSGARFSVTRYESSFHTDASFADLVVDTIGLLCLRPARSGGLSQLVNGHTVCAELAVRHPAALAILQQPFHIDRRGGARPGESPTALAPVLTLSDSGPLFRYLRFWIEAGHTRAEIPLSCEQVAALDALDEVLNDPALRVEFALEPGEMFFCNNRWILHNRTAFDDYPEVERRRHLVRLWLSRR